MEKEGKEKEEEIKKISKIELDELNRLHVTVNQAPDRLIGTLNLKQESKKNVLDYHIALSKKYKFNPWKIGINRHTGDLQILPKNVLKSKKKKKITIEKVLKKVMEEAYEKARTTLPVVDPTNPESIVRRAQAEKILKQQERRKKREEKKKNVE